MKNFNFKDVERIKKRWDERAERYDSFYNTFRGAVETYVDWKLLKNYLPKDKNSKILDAAGGTGRISLPLAKMGYSITLCDISSKMLDIAKKKMIKERIIDKIKIMECNVHTLHFLDESFDFVLCWDGMIDEIALRELIRVTKKGGTISIYLNNKWAIAIKNFYKDPNSTLALIGSHFEDQKWKSTAFSPEEAVSLLEAEGIRVLDIFAVCHWTRVLNIPEEILESYSWDQEFFKQTTDIILKLSKEPSVKGISRHLVVYGNKI